MNDHIDHLIDEYLDGSLSSSERAAVESHLKSCASCQAELRQTENIVKSARSLSPSITPARDLWTGIKPRLTSRAGAPGTRARDQVLPRTGFSRWTRTAVAAAAILAVAIIGFGGYWGYRWLQSDTGWNLAVMQGTVVLGSETISGQDRIGIGDVLRTLDDGKARIQVGIIGHVEVQPNSSLRLLSTSLSDHRLALDQGTISATIFAPPRLFFVETPSAVAVDMGCAYTLEVDDAGAGVLRVTSGWVALEFDHRESFVPAGAVCKTKPGFGPGTPYQEDASPALVEALARYDFGLKNDSDLRVVLRESRNMDSITLWHLYLRTQGDQRVEVYDRLASLVPPPRGVTRDGMLTGDPEMIKQWRKYLNLGMDSWWKVL